MEENMELNINAEINDEEDVEVSLDMPDDPIKGLTMMEISTASFFRILLPGVEEEDRKPLIGQFIDNLKNRLEFEVEHADDPEIHGEIEQGDFDDLDEDFDDDDFEDDDDEEEFGGEGFEIAPGITINI